MKKRMMLAAAALLMFSAASAQTSEYRRALDLYGHGMYAEAAHLLDGIPGSEAEGYAALCAIRMRTPAAAPAPRPSWTAGPNPRLFRR